MQYIDVHWLHNNSAEPIRLVSELDSRRYETRKLEFFRGGNVGFASTEHHSLGTELGLEPVPPLAEINESPEFRGVIISATQFESLWAAHSSGGA